MAEKRVSVRLSATGGRQVRAELEGVGEAGSRGFGRLSREMDQANARMAAFARQSYLTGFRFIEDCASCDQLSHRFRSFTY